MSWISGKWEWNDNPRNDKQAGYYRETYEQDVRFVEGDIPFEGHDFPYTQLTVGTNVSGYCIIYYNRPGDKNVPTYVAYDGDLNYWNASRIINFGEAGQEVDADFELWFRDNATKVVENPVPLSDEWVWNDTVSSERDFEVEIQFSSGRNETFNRITIDRISESDTSIFYDDLMVYEGFAKAWIDDSYKNIDFGSYDNDKTVPEVFYDWLWKNAMKASDIETIQISGKWIWNEKIIFASEVFLDVARFVSNGAPFNEIRIDNHAGAIIYDDTVVYTNDAGRLDSGYRNFNFGAVPHDCESSFYKWLVQNATYEEVTEFVLQGLWVWNDAVSDDDYLGTQAISYKANGSMRESITIFSRVYHRTVSYDDEVVYNGQNGGWSLDGDAKIVDFGTTPQTVKDAFYFWFMRNAREVPVYTIRETTLREIADAIRAKTGNSTKILVSDMAQHILDIVSDDGAEALTPDEIDAIMEV